MNTDTGRIYPPSEITSFYAPPGVPLSPDAMEYEVGVARGAVVFVSETVAQKVLLGERELERRKKRRAAEKAARKRNR